MDVPSDNDMHTTLPRIERRALRIAVLAPPWIRCRHPLTVGLRRSSRCCARNWSREDTR